MLSKVKLSSFYAQPERPYLLLDAEGNIRTDRVNKPESANAPILTWASKVPMESGGILQKPAAAAAIDALPKARKEFTIFCEEQRSEILASNPSLLGDFDERIFKVTAGLFWKEKLTEEQRQKYKDMAVAERVAAHDAKQALLEKHPELQEYLNKESAYKKAKSTMNTAQKIASAPMASANRMVKKEAKRKAEEQAVKDGKKPVAKIRRHKVSEALKKPLEKRRTKAYTIRSNKYAAARAAKKNDAEMVEEVITDDDEVMMEVEEEVEEIVEMRITRKKGGATAVATTHAKDTKKGYTGEYAFPDATQDKRQTRSQKAATADVAAKGKKAPAAKATSGGTAKRPRNRRK